MSEVGRRQVRGCQKIAVLRANALGDLHLLPPGPGCLAGNLSLCRDRPAWPTLACRVSRRAAGPGRSRDRRPPQPGRARGPGSAGWLCGRRGAGRAFSRRCKTNVFDLAVQLHGGGRHSNPFTLRLGARSVWASGPPTPSRSIAGRPISISSPRSCAASRSSPLAGATPVGLEPHLAVTQSDLDESCRVVAPSPGPEGPPLVVLHPGAGDGRRRWPPEKFAAVADALAEAGRTS